MNTRRMKSRSEPVDRLSDLPDALILTIISLLSFKECVSTSALSSRWRSLCHETTNISFRESEYVNRGQFVSNTDARDSFVSYMVKWVRRFQYSVIDTFEIYLSNPVGYVEDIKYLIEFAVSRKVRKLVLDFSEPIWRTTRDAVWLHPVIHLPACVYALTTLELLKVYAVEFDPSRFVNQEMLKTLSIGWTTLKAIESLLSKCHLLETLSMRYCWEVDIKKIEGGIRELVIENCYFFRKNCSFYLPNIEIFKYAGEFLCLGFVIGSTMMKEVSLDFEVMPEYDEPTVESMLRGSLITRFLQDLRSAKTFTACPYLLQAIQECNNPDQFLRGMEAQHLVLRTRLQPKEFMGIRMLIDNCKNLEKLTIDIVPSPPNPFPMAWSHYCTIDPNLHWHLSYTFPCLRTTLKVVVVRNFDGGVFQLDLLKYLARTGKRLVRVLQKVEIYLRKGMDQNQMAVATAETEMLKTYSKRAKVIVHNV